MGDASGCAVLIAVIACLLLLHDTCVSLKISPLLIGIFFALKRLNEDRLKSRYPAKEFTWNLS